MITPICECNPKTQRRYVGFKNRIKNLSPSEKHGPKTRANCPWGQRDRGPVLQVCLLPNGGDSVEGRGEQKTCPINNISPYVTQDKYNKQKF